MKKLLLSLLAVAGLSCAASAETYTIQFKADAGSNNQGPAISEATLVTDVVSDGADYVKSFTDFSQAYAACNSGLKIGANKQAGKLTINLSAAGTVNASKIEVYASASKNATYQKLKVNGTEFSFTANELKDDFKVCEITPSETLNSISLEKTNASTTSKEQGFVFVNKIVVTYTPAGGVVKDPANLSYETTSFNVKLGEAFTAPELVNPNNLAVTYASSNEAVATVAADGAVKIAGAGTTTITATSAETDKYYAGTASYTLTVVKSYSTVAEFYTVGANNKGLIGFDLIVTYVNGANCYAQTEDGEATLIYGSTSYEVGDIIPAGWEGQYAPFNGLDEIKPVGTMPAASGTTTFVPAEVTSVSKADMNRVVVLKNVKFDAATATGSTKTNFDGTVDEVGK